MAIVRVYYDREDENQSEYDLWYFKGYFNPEESHDDLSTPFFPRTKVSFGSNDYVDIDTGSDYKFSFFIKRKDGDFDYNQEHCEYGELTCGSTCTFCYEIGYQWSIDTNIAPHTNFYIKNTSPYVYTSSEYTDIYATGTAFIGEEDEGDGGDGVGVEDDYIRIFFSLSEYKDVYIPESERWAEKYLPWSEFWKNDIPRVQMLYLLNKSYTVGENDMNLSIDADALAIEKADAKQTLEKAIANCLFKLGEDVAAFDEDAFLADVDAYKATKNEVHEVVIDYLKESLDAHAAVSA